MIGVELGIRRETEARKTRTYGTLCVDRRCRAARGWDVILDNNLCCPKRLKEAQQGSAVPSSVPIVSAAEFSTALALRPNLVVWFLGAGASAASGIPTGYAMIRDFKAQIFCRENNLSKREIDIQLAAPRQGAGAVDVHRLRPRRLRGCKSLSVSTYSELSLSR